MAAASDLTPDERADRREIRKWLYRKYPELTAKTRRAIARGDVALDEILTLRAAQPAELEEF